MVWDEPLIALLLFYAAQGRLHSVDSVENPTVELEQDRREERAGRLVVQAERHQR